MTTIAADARFGIMCADNGWDDGTSVGRVRKVYRVRGELVGLAGTVQTMTEWLEAWRRDPLGVVAGSMKRLDEVYVLLLSHGGLQTWDAANGFLPAAERWAIGSGHHAARGALEAHPSITCHRAVVVACGIDSGSRLPVRTYRL